jgi:hypothetical protein
MKFKILAGSLTAHPNNDGTHLDNYILKLRGMQAEALGV